MSEKSLKQLLVDQKRKNQKVKKLETEVRAEKALIAKMDRSIAAKRAAAKKKGSSKKKR